MNSPVSVGIRISTRAYTYMGVGLIASGIILISMHYGIANGNRLVELVVYTATSSDNTKYPTWGGATAIFLGVGFIVVGSAIQNNAMSIKGVSLAAIIIGLVQIVAFGFACSSMASTVRYIQFIGGPQTAANYRYAAILYCVAYLIIFLTNTGICIGALFLGRKLITAYRTSVTQSDDQNKEAAGYVNPMTNKGTENL